MKALIIVLVFVSFGAYAAQLTRKDAQLAAERFIHQRLSHKQLVTFTALESAGFTYGWLATLKSNGFILLRSDNKLCPIKCYSCISRWNDLPENLRNVIQIELQAELRDLRAHPSFSSTQTKANTAMWQDLLCSQLKRSKQARAAIYQVGPLLQTTWNQCDPYNYYSPNVSPALPGFGGRAPNGCVAVAMAQVLKYHTHPYRIRESRIYSDTWGACCGTYSSTRATLDNYRYTDMRNFLTPTNSLGEQLAVAQLIYHCATSVKMDYEADGSGAYIFDCFNALGDDYSYARNFRIRISDLYNDAQWCSLLHAQVISNRPVLYYICTDTLGHALVCDGLRNDNEIHLNCGWGGAWDIWYFINNVNCGGIPWTQHGAFEVAPVAPDQWDSTDDTKTGGTILYPSGQQQSHGPHTLSRLHYYQDPSDYFIIDMVKGQSYVFHMDSTHGGRVDQNPWLIGEAGYDMAIWKGLYNRVWIVDQIAFDDVKKFGRCVAYTPKESARYYIQIYNANYTYGCWRGYLCYSTTNAVDQWDPQDSTAAGATTLATPTTSPQSHGPHLLFHNFDSEFNTYNPAQVDVFKVYLVKNNRYRFDSIGGSGDTRGSLEDPDGNVVFDDNSGGNLQFLIDIVAPKTGNYYLSVDNIPQYHNCSYNLNYRKY